MAVNVTDKPRRVIFGEFLKGLRTAKRYTLRQVEELTNKEVSNAYLSQLENGKITKPSPQILHHLAIVLEIPYERLMEEAGYLHQSSERQEGEHHGRVATLAIDDLDDEEEQMLLDYLKYLRQRRKKDDQ
tara:strand:- start:1266 stop:1655 length:390 start_codon:yes stop_codon:yes gene_type:complete